MTATALRLNNAPSDRAVRAVLLVVQLLAELLVTIGAVFLLFAGYQVFWTTARSTQAQQRVVENLELQWQLPAAPVTPTAPAAQGPTALAQAQAAPPGEAFALLRIPRFGADYRMPLVEGTTQADLDQGVGHYPGTALPGQVGNLGIAGHRVTHGQPFRHLDELQVGDPLIVETRTDVFTYRVQGSEVVAPDQGDVLLPVPRRPGVEATAAVMTLTTCHPEWSARQRLIVHAQLESSRSKA